MLQKKFLSIQSCVSYGHVGNSAITFPLQRLGALVYPIHTVLFSNHTGYGSWRGKIFETSLVEDVFQGVKERGALNDCHALLTGYMGSAQLGQIMQKSLRELRQLNSDVIYCCDPVIGDVGRGIFVRPGVPEFFKDQMIKLADIITPNHFELEYISETIFDTVEKAILAAKKVMARGPKIVLITSLRLGEKKDKINILAVDSEAHYLITTPFLPVNLNGTGDLTAALFTYFYLQYKKINIALEQTIARVYSLIVKTLEAGAGELVLVQAQDQFISPEYFFTAIEV